MSSEGFTQEAKLQYPETKRIDQVDEYHGTKVPDPYRWLEDDVRTSPDVAAWVEKQNEVTSAYLNSIEGRKAIEKRLTELWNYERYSSPAKRGGKYFFFKNDGLQNQNVLYMQETLDSDPEVLMDPNAWSADGTIALSGMVFSEDGTKLAYGVAEAGSDWNTWRVMDVATKKVMDDEIRWMKFGSPAWTKDGAGFYYGRYREPKEGAAYQSLNFNQAIYYHRLGTPQSADEIVFRNDAHPEWGYQAQVTEDGAYLVITVWKGTDDKYRVFYQQLDKPDQPIVSLIDNFDNEYTLVGNDGSSFYFKTDLEAPTGRLIAIDVNSPERDAWREIIASSENTLRGVSLIQDNFIAEYLEDARTMVRVFDLTGKHVRDVELPGIGTATGFGGKRTERETFYSFSSFATPPSIYRYDVVTGESKLWRQAEVDFDPEQYQVDQVFYTSKDGTKIPMFLTYKKGIKRDGKTPTLLYGYGGFNIPITPSFAVSRVAWMEMGGIYAVANLRGGGEYGEAWHRAGTKLQKQNVFDDFIAAAEWLIENKYTSSAKLAIQGRSNGGLLVGACMAQRPDLFGVCLPGVGVMDMLRFHKFTAGRFWVDDYGSSDNQDEFQAIYAYSPYHNLKPGTKYPATLVTTADTDDRVVPGHSFKFAAELQRCQAGDAPVLIRIETRAGHGAGTPTSKQIEEVADWYAFVLENIE
jgi:prolyl oligopeptidase